MFIQPDGTGLELYSANGDLNNNVIMHPAIAQGTDEGETCIVTALWDWSPVASWDSGRYVTFRLNFRRFDHFELDLRGHIHVRGAAFSCFA